MGPAGLGDYNPAMEPWSSLMLESLRRRWLQLILTTLLVILLVPIGSDSAYIAALEQARTAVESNRPETALAALQRAFELQPPTPELSLLAAESALRAGQLVLAQRYLAGIPVSEIMPGRVDCLRARLYAARGQLDRLPGVLGKGASCPAALMEVRRSAVTSFEEGRWDQAEAAARILDRYGSSDPELTLLLIQLDAARDPSHAREKLRAWQIAGHDLTGLSADLLETLRRALLQEDIAFRYALVGQTFARHGEWQLATRAFENSLAIDPNYAQARAYYGLALERSGHNGRQEILAAFEADPQNPLPLAFLSSLALEEGRTEAARSLMERAVRLAPEDPALLSQLAAALAAAGDLTGARATLLEAVTVEPREPGIWLAIANLSLQSEIDIQQVAIPAARQALILDPHSAAAADSLGYTHLLSGDTSLARRLFQRAVRSDPRLTSAWYHLGLAHLELGDTLAARTALEQVQELEPDSATSELARRALSRLP